MTGDVHAAAALENMRPVPSSAATGGSAGQCGAPCCASCSTQDSPVDQTYLVQGHVSFDQSA